MSPIQILTLSSDVYHSYELEVWHGKYWFGSSSWIDFCLKFKFIVMANRAGSTQFGPTYHQLLTDLKFARIAMLCKTCKICCWCFHQNMLFKHISNAIYSSSDRTLSMPCSRSHDAFVMTIVKLTFLAFSKSWQNVQFWQPLNAESQPSWKTDKVSEDRPSQGWIHQHQKHNYKENPQVHPSINWSAPTPLSTSCKNHSLSSPSPLLIQVK